MAALTESHDPKRVVDSVDCWGDPWIRVLCLVIIVPRRPAGLILTRLRIARTLGRSNMTTSDRKKPGVAFWASVAFVAVLVGYPLSFGPACWISSATGDRKHVSVDFVNFIYQPLLRASNNESESLGAYIAWYANLGAQQGWQIGDRCFCEGRYWDQ